MRKNVTNALATLALSSLMATQGAMAANLVIPNIGAGTVGVKFYPGHYLEPIGGDKRVTSFSIKEAYDDINAANSGIVGLQIRLSWKELEPTQDNYAAGFAIIDGHLNKLKNENSNKRIILFVKHKGEDPDGIIPDYIKNMGGAYTYGSSINSTVVAENAKLWNDAVRDRFIKLMQALGNRYNRHSHFVGVIMPETTTGVPININISDAQLDKYYANLLVINQAMRNAFPNTITSQFVNFPRERLKNLIGGLKNMGAGIGGPDIWLNDTSLSMAGTQYTEPGAYTYYPLLSNIVALTPSVMSGNYKRTIADKETADPSIDSLLDFGRDKLKANIMFWTRTPDYYPLVLNKLKTLTQQGSSRVKLNGICPSMYVNCIKDR